jgi:very-short-patch-repair endonuclease
MKRKFKTVGKARLEQVKKFKCFSISEEKLEEKEELIIKCLMLNEFYNESTIKCLSRLVNYSNSDLEIQSNYVSLFNLYYSDKKFKFSNSLANLQLLYGDSEGIVRYELAQKARSENGKKSGFCLSHWIDKGYSEKEAKDILHKQSAKSQENADYSNRKYVYKHSLGFWTKLGYSLEDAEELRKPYLFATGTSIESFIHRHGDIDGAIKYNLCCKRRAATIEKNYGSRSFASGYKGKASKQSLQILLPLYTKYKDAYKIYIGYGDEKEWWVNDHESRKKIYFVDFCIPELKLVIEFNGIEWHPKSKDSFEKYGILKDKYLELCNNDTRKHASISNAGFELLVVWNDDTIINNMIACDNFIKRKINENS